jgi:hypothetical protein
MKINEETTKSFEKNQRAIEKNLESCEKARNVAEQYDMEDIIFIVNINQFVMLFNYDLNILGYDLLATEQGWRRKLYARLLALLIVEFLEDVGELLGKSFRSKVIAISDKSASIDRLNSILKQLNQLRSKHEKDLRSIRNIAIGHKDKDAKRQVEVINNLDIDGLQSLAIDITNWITSYSLFLTDLIDAITGQVNGSQSEA